MSAPPAEEYSSSSSPDSVLVRIAQKPLVVAVLFVSTALFPWLIYFLLPVVASMLSSQSLLWDFLQWLPVPMLFILVNCVIFLMWIRSSKQVSSIPSEFWHEDKLLPPPLDVLDKPPTSSTAGFWTESEQHKPPTSSSSAEYWPQPKPTTPATDQYWSQPKSKKEYRHGEKLSPMDVLDKPPTSSSAEYQPQPKPTEQYKPTTSEYWHREKLPTQLDVLDKPPTISSTEYWQPNPTSQITEQYWSQPKPTSPTTEQYRSKSQLNPSTPTTEQPKPTTEQYWSQPKPTSPTTEQYRSSKSQLKPSTPTTEQPKLTTEQYQPQLKLTSPTTGARPPLLNVRSKSDSSSSCSACTTSSSEDEELENRDREAEEVLMHTEGIRNTSKRDDLERYILRQEDRERERHENRERERKKKAAAAIHKKSQSFKGELKMDTDATTATNPNARKPRKAPKSKTPGVTRRNSSPKAYEAATSKASIMFEKERSASLFGQSKQYIPPVREPIPPLDKDDLNARIDNFLTKVKIKRQQSNLRAALASGDS